MRMWWLVATGVFAVSCVLYGVALEYHRQRNDVRRIVIDEAVQLEMGGQRFHY